MPRRLRAVRSTDRGKRSKYNEVSRPRDTLWNRLFAAGYSTYVSLSRARTQAADNGAGKLPSLTRAEDGDSSKTLAAHPRLKDHEQCTPVKEPDYCPTKTLEQVVYVANTEDGQGVNDYLRRGNSDGEFGRKNTQLTKSKPTNHHGIRRWIESGEYIEFLRRGGHGGWNWFDRRRKKSLAYLEMRTMKRGCTNPQSSDHEVRVQPVTREIGYAREIDSATFRRQLKFLLLDKSEPSSEQLMRLSCELKTFIALRRRELHGEMGKGSTGVVDMRTVEGAETQRDRPSSLAPSRAVSPDDTEQRTSANSRSGHRSLTENSNAIAPRSVRESGGHSVLSPRLTQSVSTSGKNDSIRAPSEAGALTETRVTESNNKPQGCCGRGKKKNEDATEQDLSPGFESEASDVSRGSKQGSIFSQVRKSSSRPGSKLSFRSSAGKLGRDSSADKSDKLSRGKKVSPPEPTTISNEPTQGRRPSTFGLGPRIGAPGVNVYNQQGPVSHPLPNSAAGAEGSCAGVDGLCRCSLMSANQAPYLGPSMMSPQSLAETAAPTSYAPYQPTEPEVGWSSPPAVVNSQSPQSPTYPAPLLNKGTRRPPKLSEAKVRSSAKASLLQPRISEPFSPAESPEEDEKSGGRIICGDYEESSSKRSREQGSSMNTSREDQHARGCCFRKKRNSKSENSDDNLNTDDLDGPLGRRSVGSFKNSKASGSLNRARPSGKQKPGTSLVGGRKSSNAKHGTSEDSLLQDSSARSPSLKVASGYNKARSNGQKTPGQNFVHDPQAGAGGAVTPLTTRPPTPLSRPIMTTPSPLSTVNVSPVRGPEHNWTPSASPLPERHIPAAMENGCRMCPLHCRPFISPHPGQLAMVQPTPTESLAHSGFTPKATAFPAYSSVAPTPPIATSQNVMACAGMEGPGHMVEVQVPGHPMNGVTMVPPNETPNQPIVQTSVADLAEQRDVPKSEALFVPPGGQGTDAPTHTIEIQFHGERMSSVTVATKNAASNRPTIYAPPSEFKEQSEKSKSTASATTLRSDVPGIPSRSASSASVGSRLSKQTEGGSEAASRLDEKQEEGSTGGKGCCGKRKRKPADNEEEGEADVSKRLEGKDAKMSMNTEGTGATGERRPSQRPSLLSCYKKQTSDQAEHETDSRTQSAVPGQKSLKLSSKYMADDGRKPESVQPFEYTPSRSASYSLAAANTSELSWPGLEAPLHSTEVKSQAPRLSCINVTASKAMSTQPAFHSTVTDMTEKSETARPWKPRSPEADRGGRSPENASPAAPKEESRFIVGQRPGTPAGAGQTVMVNPPDNAPASLSNGTTVECCMDPGGFGQQRQPGLNNMPRCQCTTCPRIRPLPQNGCMTTGQTVWVLMPMAMGANGMVGMPAPCPCHGRR
ncbi:unnamed protein product [Schistocephalus solidus]|uniref:Uncharacterized protein n=1 Tax=Schistocephalus solidus TaxID=70667 RepID=A0A183SKB7_SCHSO|nr:unnamed protein product [Schistocephalus solidus]